MLRKAKVLVGVFVVTGGVLVCVLLLTGRFGSCDSASTVTPPPASGAKKEQEAQEIPVTTQPASAPVASTRAAGIDLSGIGRELTEREQQKAVKLLRNPVHPGRARLQERMRQETPEQTFSHLTDNDSMAMLQPLMGGFRFSPGSYVTHVMAIHKLARMRKLLSDVQQDPQRLVAFLRDQLVVMAEDFPRADKEYLRAWEGEYYKKHRSVQFDELPDIHQYKIRSAAAVYLLAEVDGSASLPIFAWLSVQGQPGGYPGSSWRGPIDHKLLLFATHKLVAQFDEGRVSPEARSARRAYLALAEFKGVPTLRTAKVTSWKAHYHEDDFRQMMPAQGLDMRNEPTIEVTRYPLFTKLDTEDVEQLLATARAFVQLAFPDAAIGK